VQPVGVVLFLAEPQRPFQQPGRDQLRVLGVGLDFVVGPTSASVSSGTAVADRLPRREARVRVVPPDSAGSAGGAGSSGKLIPGSAS
jgi:hypothetical protein